MRTKDERNLVKMGMHIRNLRKRNLMSQQELAEKLEISPMTMSRIENGLTPASSLMYLKMSGLFQVPVEDIYNGAGVEDYVF